MSKALEALDALYDLMDGYFCNDQLKRKYGITEETARDKRLIIESELEKLGRLEGIEDKMGVSLTDVLESAMNSFVGVVDGSEATFFAKSVNLKKMTISGVAISGGFGGKITYKTFKIAEYGKTWARTRREMR